jgi:hypothetical protein
MLVLFPGDSWIIGKQDKTGLRTQINRLLAAILTLQGRPFPTRSD